MRFFTLLALVSAAIAAPLEKEEKRAVREQHRFTSSHIKKVNPQVLEAGIEIAMVLDKIFHKNEQFCSPEKGFCDVVGDCCPGLYCKRTGYNDYECAVGTGEEDLRE